MGPSPKGCLEESSVVGQEEGREGKGLWEERNCGCGGTEAQREIVWGMTVVHRESGLGAGSEREEKERWKPYSDVPPGAKLGSLDMILKPDVGVRKGRPRISFEFRKSLGKDWSGEQGDQVLEGSGLRGLGTVAES